MTNGAESPTYDDALIRVKDLIVEFPIKGGRKVHAVSGVSFEVRQGETLGLVGESGCGKSTTARALMQLPRPTSGTVQLGEELLTSLSGSELRRVRPRFQMIFQDPVSSLDPRRTVRELMGEGLDVWHPGEPKQERIDEVLNLLGFDPDAVGEKRPHELSGGQCQRVCIGRAVILDPDVLVCDEPVSALDVSVQAHLLNLLEAMKERYGLTMIFIAHDLAVVKSVSDRIMVMYLGKVAEVATPDALYETPAHPYTNLLVSSIPVAEPGQVPTRPAVVGEPPSPIDPPSGCRFHPRCPRAAARCATEEPLLRLIAPEHSVACHYPVMPGESVATTSPEKV